LLTGVLHLAPLPGSPRSALSAREIARRAADEARTLASCGFDAILVENFGDAPFLDHVTPITISSMTIAALAVRDACPGIKIGVNVLRNDASAALGIAASVGGEFFRINVHAGARVSDQGILVGQAGATLRERRALGVEHIEVWADVDVKHSAPLGPIRIEDEAKDLVARGLASAVLVTGPGTGEPVNLAKLEIVRSAVEVPVFVASGATIETLERLARSCDGVIVGSALREGGKAGARLDPGKARDFAEAFKRAFDERV
jgi:uncharacterized protein